MTEDRNISANFSVNSYDLLISPEEGGFAEGNGTFEYGTYANIYAIPDTGYVFNKWNGSGISSPLESNTTVYMTGDRNISASFDLNSYELHLYYSIGGSAFQSGSTTHGSYAFITAFPESGYSFLGWSGEGVLDPFSVTSSVEMTDDRNITAHFTMNMNSLLNPKRIEGDWFESWFGIYNQVNDMWIYHLHFGWLLLKIEEANLWIWHEKNGWHWTNEDSYDDNFLWSDLLQSWIFFDHDSTSQTKYFNYLSNNWLNWHL